MNFSFPQLLTLHLLLSPILTPKRSCNPFVQLQSLLIKERKENSSTNEIIKIESYQEYTPLSKRTPAVSFVLIIFMP
jgi:hypothetical protein